MRYMYLLLLFSLGALLWAAFSIARHIQKHGKQAGLSSAEQPEAAAVSDVSDQPGVAPLPLAPKHETQDEALTDKQRTNGSQQ